MIKRMVSLSLLTILAAVIFIPGGNAQQIEYKYDKDKEAARERKLMKEAKEGTARVHYHTGYRSFLRGRYETTRMMMEEVFNEYPQSEVCDDARYLIGETYYVVGDFSRALAEFQRVISEYPKGDKILATQLKIGLCLYELDDFSQAYVELKKVTDDYPESEEAITARRKMKKARKIMKRIRKGKKIKGK